MEYKRYSDEFKWNVLTMVTEGGRSVAHRSVAQLALDLEITPGLLYKWQQRDRVKDDKRKTNQHNRWVDNKYHAVFSKAVNL